MSCGSLDMAQFGRGTSGGGATRRPQLAVLFRVFAKCLDGAVATANARIEATLRGGRWPTEHCPTPAPHKLVTTRDPTKRGEAKAP